MTRLTDLDVACRKSGLRVVAVAGWKGRGRPGGMRGDAPTGIAVHHTATSAKAAGNYPSMRIVRDGRPGLPGPLAQLGLGRDGTVYVLAAGRCNHAGKTDRRGSDNYGSIGIEAEHPGRGDWPKVQRDAYAALCAALATHYGIPVDMIRGHKEIAVPRGRKNDPNFDMGAFRSEVRALIAGGDIGAQVTTPPRDPRYGHRGVPKPLSDDGVYGGRTHDAFMWVVGGDRLVGFTRDNVRDVQTWAGRPRTGKFDDGDIRAIQEKVGAVVDGDWPIGRESNTTVGVQRFINRRIADAKKGQQ